MMDIRVKAPVECMDGRCGHCTDIVLNPQSEQVTHLVIQEEIPPHTQRLVPIARVGSCDSNSIHLNCKCRELEAMEDFVEREEVSIDVPPTYLPGELAIPSIGHWPTTQLTVEHLRLPQDEIALHHGAPVQAPDGLIGHVDELLVDPAGGRITHLVLSEGHLWGKQQVMIPVWLIDHIGEDTIYLKLNKRYVSALPTVRAHSDHAKER